MLTGNKNLDFKILNELEDKDLVSVYQTNHQVNELCNNQTFWLNRILNKFPYLGVDVLKQYKQERSWSQYYIEDLRQVTPTNAQIKLIAGSRKGRLDLVIIAVDKGADIRAGSYRTNTASAVIGASGYGHLEVVQYLVSQGANIRARNDESVRNASFKGHLDVIDYLVSQGADIRASNNFAVRYASKNGHLDVVKYLVSQGADIRVYNDEAVRMACFNGHSDVVDYLVSQGAPDPLN